MVVPCSPMNSVPYGTQAGFTVNLHRKREAAILLWTKFTLTVVNQQRQWLSRFFHTFYCIPLSLIPDYMKLPWKRLFRFYISNSLFLQSKKPSSGSRGSLRVQSHNFQSVLQGLLEVPEILPEAQSQNYFHSNIKPLFACFAVLTSVLVAQKHRWVPMLMPQHESDEAVAPNSTNSHGIPHSHALGQTNKPKKVEVLFQNIVDEAVKYLIKKNINVSTHLFNMLCGKMGNMHKALQLYLKVKCLSPGDPPVRLPELRDELNEPLFSWTTPHHAYLKEKLTDCA